MTGFSVDTKLFQELGELLVAKESTALVELIKNAYDADATVVTVTGMSLTDADRGMIVVSDDGVGMDSGEFQRGFLTIAGRTKNTGDRRSPVFGRRYTGEKGVGRLATHKLGRKVEVQSRKAGPAPRGATRLPAPVDAIEATIDWDAIEQLETLDEVNESGAVEIQERGRPAATVDSGTTLVIAPLRKAWTERMRNAFLSEAATLAPLPATYEMLPEGLLAEPLLFDEVPIRDRSSSDPGFKVVFGKELGISDQLLADRAAAAHWIAELAYDRDIGTMDIAVAPTAAGLKNSPTSEGFRFSKQIGLEAGPTFRGRILQMSNARWDAAVQGIRIFMEGFRVPPYGDARDDWLGLESTYVSRQHRKLISLSAIDTDGLPEGLENEEIVIQPNAAYMGAIFLHRSTSDGLEMLVNREGFLAGPELDFIADWTRVATDLVVRLGALARKEVKHEKAEARERQRKAVQRADVNETPTALRVRESAIKVQSAFDSIREAVERNEFDAVAAHAANLQPDLSEIRDLADQFGSEAVQWRVLASLGAELAAFVHEIHAVGAQIAVLARELDDALTLEGIRQTRTAIRGIRTRALALADRIRRNAAYVVDATSFEGRRRRSRLPVLERVRAVEEFFRTRLEQKNIDLEYDIDGALRTPPMFPSELSGIFTNLFSNAVKFTDEDGEILIEARERNRFFEVRMSNTGTPVDRSKSERLFDAFRSTTERPDAVLGQGMGMGLTITRAFIQEYGGEIYFGEPPEGYATAIVFKIPQR